MLKICSCFLGHFLVNVFIGLASLSFIRCACQPNFEVSSETQTTPSKKDNPNNPQKPILTEITNEMIEKAREKFKPFLASQLEKLQKEERTNDQVAYINDIDTTDGGVSTALHSAVYADLLLPDIVKALLERGADPNQLVNKQTPLYTAVSCMPERNLDNIRLLVEAGADPELGVEHNYPILTAIVNSGDNALSAIELMLNKVTNINKQYVQGNTILHCAVDVQATKVVKLLLEKNADFNIRNDVGETAKEMAKFKGKSIKEQFFAP